MLDGIRRIINSAKVQTTVAAAFTAWVTYYFSDGTPAEKAPLKLAMVIAVGTCVGIVLLAWAAEDFAAKRSAEPAKPTTQVNVQSDVQNPTPVAAAVAPTPEPKPEPTEKQLLLAIYQHLRAQSRPQPPAPTPPPASPAAHETSA